MKEEIEENAEQSNSILFSLSRFLSLSFDSITGLNVCVCVCWIASVKLAE